MQTSIASPARGKTYFQGQTPPLAADYGATAQLEGIQATFAENSATVTGAALRNRPTGRSTTCMLVRNTTGGTLAPGIAVAWEDNYRHRRVDAVATAEGAIVAGFVDDKIVGTVPAGDLFWVMREGYAQVTGDDAAFAVNAAMGVGAAGVADADASPDIYTVGHVIVPETVSGGLPLLQLNLCINH